MTLVRLSLSVVSGTSSGALGSARERQHTRAGLLLELWDAEGRRGLGEASPLPGYSQDSLEPCQVALDALDLEQLGARFRAKAGFLERLAQCAALLPQQLPAARFALETALLDLSCRQSQRTPFEVLGLPFVGSLPVSALMDASAPDALGHAEELVRQGFRSAKLKLGQDLESEVALLERLVRWGGLRLRADANQCFSATQLGQWLPRLARLGLEFLEEPCDPALWTELPEARPWLALDESLQGRAPGELGPLSERSGARVIVLKPMALGGFSACLELARQAKRLGLRPVVTHLFDGPVAHRATSVLGLVVQKGELAAGLARHPGLDVWPALPLALESASVLAASAFGREVSGDPPLDAREVVP